MSEVRVHYNSKKPVAMQAHAYTQGNDIHLVLGQGKHLPHQAWQVVQQRQGRVKPALQTDGCDTLEKEADMMGAEALLLDAKQKLIF